MVLYYLHHSSNDDDDGADKDVALVSKQDKSGLEKLVTFVGLDLTLGSTIYSAWHCAGVQRIYPSAVI